MIITVVSQKGKTTVVDRSFKKGEERALRALFLIKGEVDSRTDVVYDNVEQAIYTNEYKEEMKRRYHTPEVQDSPIILKEKQPLFWNLDEDMLKTQLLDFLLDVDDKEKEE